MAIGDDWEIQDDRDVRYVGSGVKYTGLEVHEWARGLRGAASSSGDDLMDITRRTPTSKAFDKSISFVNSYNIDDYSARISYRLPGSKRQNCSVWHQETVLRELRLNACMAQLLNCGGTGRQGNTQDQQRQVTHDHPGRSHFAIAVTPVPLRQRHPC